MIMTPFKAAGLAASLFILLWFGISYLPKPYEIFKTQIKANAVNVAVIYAKRIKAESKAYKNFEESFEKEREKFYQEILEKEKQLREEEIDLKKLPKTKNKDKIKYHKLYTQFREKAELTENELQTRKEMLLKKANDVTQKLEDELNKVIEDIIKDYDFNLVLNADLDDKRLVMYADKHFDISDEIIKRMNLKKVA